MLEESCADDGGDDKDEAPGNEECSEVSGEGEKCEVTAGKERKESGASNHWWSLALFLKVGMLYNGKRRSVASSGVCEKVKEKEPGEENECSLGVILK